ncbi:uncharacterized protein LOC124695624 [Lolium rigidum]|uniref:uncharacterized protein LOC124695624 n=1 Tax=Lolium rigidum TaxID=89674 RepID=UPI001F5DD995|nr:uncharacterized protein LOC124695624 [Lolium rigidum]
MQLQYKFSSFQPLLPDVRDFPVRLRPYAKNYIDNRNKEYIVAKEQARLHEQFDAHLASGVLDHYLSKGDAGSHGDALKAVLNDSRQFSALDHDLIKLSFERRAELLGRRDQLHLFYKCFQRVTRDAQLRIEVQSLIDQLGRQDFFCIDDDAIDWDQKCCSELVDKFNKQVFTGSDLPKYYVIRGIMDYRAMSRMKDGSCSWCDVFQKVVGKPYDRWIQNIPSFWMDTRYYKHQYYDIIQQPLQKVRYFGIPWSGSLSFPAALLPAETSSTEPTSQSSENPRYEIGTILEMVMGDFCVETADRSALANECMRLYSELATEKIRIRILDDIAMKSFTESNEIQRRSLGQAETMDKLAGPIPNLTVRTDKLEAELSQEKALNSELKRQAGSR